MTLFGSYQRFLKLNILLFKDFTELVSKSFKNNLGFLPDAIENLFIANATVHSYNTRNRHKLRAAHGHISVLGYEPACLTVHPPPQNDRGWVHSFHMGV